jgi:hypothetical protein
MALTWAELKLESKDQLLAWVWLSGEPDAWEETHEQQLRTSHLRADAGPCIVSVSILVSLTLGFELEHFIIYVSLL